MSHFYAKFTRYRDHERRVSAHVHFNADTFAAAVTLCEHRLKGMRAADPVAVFDLVALGTDDYHGVDCTGGVHLFETGEEAEARLNAEVKP